MRRCSACSPRPGMRLGEAIGLDRADADLDDGVLTIRDAKFGRYRLVPLHPTVTSALAGYAAAPRPAVPQPGNDPVLRLRRRHAAAHQRRRPAPSPSSPPPWACAPRTAVPGFMT